jgi:hypothetical protein
LIRVHDTEQVNLNLQSGRVRAEVNAPTDAGIEFNVRSSSATASVRGTVFEFDTLYLFVISGTVEFYGELGLPILIDGPGSGFVDDRTFRTVYQRRGSTELRQNLPIASEIVRPVYRTMETESSLPSVPGTPPGILLDLSTIVWF